MVAWWYYVCLDSETKKDKKLDMRLLIKSKFVYYCIVGFEIELTLLCMNRRIRKWRIVIFQFELFVEI